MMKYKSVMRYTSVTQQVERKIPVGYWLVEFTGDYSGGPYSIKPIISEINESDYDTHEMSIDDNTDKLGDDTHDFRSRLFETKEAAEKHVKYTMDRWEHPEVWESFVRFD